MELLVLGTGHSVAPAHVRERMHVELEEVSETLVNLLTERGVLSEAVALATCARLEVYALASEPDRATRVLVRLMARRTGVPAADVLEHGYTLRGEDAVRHLFRVAAGLDSVVHGEAQILGQVREAAHDPLSAHGKGPVLHRLFEAALSTGKRVRTETEIGRGAASLASAALSMLRREVGELGSRTALVLGAGETGSLMARLLRKAHVGRLLIANRTEETARELAKELGAEGHGLSELGALIAEADVVVGATAGPEPLVTRELVEHAAASHPRPCRHYLDLAHPRSIDRGIVALPGARLIDLQDVFERVESARHARSAQVPMAESIVAEQAEAFMRWHRSRDNVRVLRAMREQVLERAREEAERLGRGRSEREREEISHFARRLARTLLHAPTVALRDADPRSSEGRALLETAEVLFGIPPAGEDEERAR
jgi:glutamyl-tRNA reductase